MKNFELPEPCENFEHLPVVVHRTGGLSAEIHNRKVYGKVFDVWASITWA